ncbi:MAG: right-handed parallel beta-helix repeat-containing protein [Deltaproteobacteria bacterium]|nr:right-handed parallel beta-helix repeat-containing protein [Deltaproteobacteria bacterium]
MTTQAFAARSVVRAGLFLAAWGSCGGAASEPPPSARACPLGSMVGPDDACIEVGLPACAAPFVAADGSCQPSMERCNNGEIPGFATGCTPVGVLACAAVFVGADGHCRPALDACGPGTSPLPSEGCVPIDGPAGCVVGRWGDGLEESGAVHVDVAAASGGDGTADGPFTSLAAAIAKAPSGGRVVVAAGEYDEAVVIDKPLSLAGRCPSRVTLRGGSDPKSLAIVVVRKTSDVVIEGVRFQGPHVGMLVDDASAKLRRAVVEGAVGFGIVALGSATQVDIDHVLVVDTSPRAGDQSYGRAVEVELGAEVRLASSALLGNREVGAFASGLGTRLTVEASFVGATQPNADEKRLGHGVEVAEGASARIIDSVLLGNHEHGVFVAQPGTTATLEGCLVTDTLPRASQGDFGRGLAVQSGGRATVRASALVGNREHGILVTGSGSDLDVEGTLVSGTLSRASDGRSGRGIEITDGAIAAIARSLVHGNREIGIDSDGSTLTLDASLVTDTGALDDGSYGVGLLVNRGSATVRQVLVRGSATVGVLFSGSTATLERSTIDGVLEGAFHEYDGLAGMETITATFDGIADGLVAVAGATVNATDVRVRGVRRGGVVFEASGGLLRGVRAEGGRFCLVLQGDPKPDPSDATNAFLGTDANLLTDGTLPVPGPPPIPVD